ncbi:MAG: hypothetical protein ACR2LK_12835, partial [Solirubrobacteraceae bacterium]
ADLAASRRMKTTRVGGGHPGYLVLSDPDPENPDAPRVTAQQDLWHDSFGRMVDACAAADLLPFYGPFGDIKDVAGCEAQFRAAFIMGCVGAWSLHPAQIDIAKKVFSPDPDEVRFAKRVIEAIPDGSGVHMIDRQVDERSPAGCRSFTHVMQSAAGVADGNNEVSLVHASHAIRGRSRRRGQRGVARSCPSGGRRRPRVARARPAIVTPLAPVLPPAHRPRHDRRARPSQTVQRRSPSAALHCRCAP